MPGFCFAEADTPLDKARYVLYGVPFDRTASFRSGAKDAPLEIRKASYNFETFMFEHGVDLIDVPIHDMGDTDELGSTDDMAIEVAGISHKIAKMSKFPIAIGGEHSISPPAMEGLVSKYDDLGVLVVDAHLDFRNEYLGDKNNHACANRRFSDLVGVDKILPVGIRSICKEELEDAKEQGLDWVTSFEANKMGAKDVVARLLKKGVKHVYLSIDIDGIDPAYAPGTGTPEPFGLQDTFVKDLIQALAPVLVGMDIVEVCPPADNGNTSALAARLIREVLAATTAK